MSLCVCECVCVCLYRDIKAYHLTLPPEAWQNRARWQWLRRAFPPSQNSTRDRVSLALCKQETCACSALSAATVMRVTFSSLYTQHDGQHSHAGREEKKNIIGWAYLVINNKALKELAWQSRLNGNVCNERKAIIHHCFISFLYDIIRVNLYSITERNCSNLIKNSSKNTGH